MNQLFNKSSYSHQYFYQNLISSLIVVLNLNGFFFRAMSSNAEEINETFQENRGIELSDHNNLILGDKSPLVDSEQSLGLTETVTEEAIALYVPNQAKNLPISALRLKILNPNDQSSSREILEKKFSLIFL